MRPAEQSHKTIKLHENVKAQLNLFYLALSFFTRLPVPSSMYYSETLLNKANRYFSLVGLVIGLLLIVSFVIFSYFLPSGISILLMMMTSLLITGAFHEDGLADMADGIGGAFTRDKRLAIMKDSRIGTYGSVSLLMALLLKYSVLVELAKLDTHYLLYSVILAAGLSRAVAGSIISSLPYVSDEQQSKSKPLAARQSSKELLILVLIGAAPLLFLPLEVIFYLVGGLVLFRCAFNYWLLRRVGGFTGDCLGAAQQISELLIYLILIINFNEQVFLGLLA
jgi:adenosylcobinamide-GDP ribazoletransferase